MNIDEDYIDVTPIDHQWVSRQRIKRTVEEMENAPRCGAVLVWHLLNKARGAKPPNLYLGADVEVLRCSKEHAHEGDHHGVVHGAVHTWDEYTQINRREI